MKQLSLILIVSTFAFGFTTTKNHDFFVSVAEVDYFPVKKEIQVALKIFTDDLETAIQKDGKRLYLDTSTEIKNADDYIKKYLDKNFQLKTDNNLQTLDYIGKEYNDDATWLYFKYSNLPKKPKVITLKNTVIIAVHSKQTNMTHFRKNRTLVSSSNLGKDRSIMIIKP
jgi:hypothetical protein